MWRLTPFESIAQALLHRLGGFFWSWFVTGYGLVENGFTIDFYLEDSFRTCTELKAGEDRRPS